MIARNSHNKNEAVILEQNPIKIFSEKRLHKVHQYLHVFRFDGTYLELEAHLEGMTEEQALSYIDLEIRVIGMQQQSFDRCCCVSTYLLGGLLLLPFFLLCTDCWKRCIYEAYFIDKAIYEKLSVLLKSPHVKSMVLKVNDSAFNSEKASILFKLIKESSIGTLNFINQAGEYNYEDDSYSKFEENMRPLKKLTNVASDLRWGSRIVPNQ